jgi:hypothetical protein
MSYKVFISHSSRDQGLVISLANLLTRFGIEVYVAEWYLSPGEKLDSKVFREIDNSNCMVVLLTQNGTRSNWVQQEIGYALSKGKHIIPLVEDGTTGEALGALRGREYIKYDPYQPQQALVTLSDYIKRLKLDKEEQDKTLLVTAGILAFILLLSGSKK